MRFIRLLSLHALCFGVFLTAAGCSGPTLTPVTGKVTVAGKPLQTGTVTYHPDKAKGNTKELAQFPMGTISQDGQYTLDTAGKPGAPAGWYKVTVKATTTPTAKDSNSKAAYAVPRSLIDEVNGNAETTNLSVEVKAGAAPGSYDLKLPK